MDHWIYIVSYVIESAMTLYDVSKLPNLDFLALHLAISDHTMPSAPSIPDTAASGKTGRSDGSASESVEVAPSTGNSEPASGKVNDRNSSRLHFISPSLATLYTGSAPPSVEGNVGKVELYDDAFEDGETLKLKVQPHDSEGQEGEDTIDFPES
jgi:hypothetical protein